ncbi:S41 family peptidase [Deinococcus sp. QL22]|uniref:S41 family peptidase n=1 Tax=Deinococcus sp. QL22 TaxID=2939437 RepID=UPI002016E188|nr:S41 family peptidase [Deinococcus sp. QL22]UQN06470.1 S41 family peptidase [Deinococcus sp. QL22]
MRLRPLYLLAAFLLLAASQGTAGGVSAPRAIDAYAVFDAAAHILKTTYAGPRMLEVGALVDRQRQALVVACSTAVVCPEKRGRSVVDAVIKNLGDGHSGAHWNVAVTAVQEPADRRLTGLRLFPLLPGELHVTHVRSNSAAERAGIQAGDALLGFAGQSGMQTHDQLHTQLLAHEERGEPFEVRLRSAGQIKTVTLQGELSPAVTLPSLRWAGKVAVISLPSLRTSTGLAFVSLVSLAGSQGAQGLVVDLRWNPGGFMSEALIASQVLAGEQVSLKTVDRFGTVSFDWRVWKSQQAVFIRDIGLETWNKPVIVLTSAQTASAGEMLAYWAQRSGAQVMGEATMGLLNTGVAWTALPGGSTLQVSDKRITLDGRTWLPERVEPDQVVVNTPGDWRAGKDRVMERAVASIAQMNLAVR